jgi:hypothetical protein
MSDSIGKFLCKYCAKALTIDDRRAYCRPDGAALDVFFSFPGDAWVRVSNTRYEAYKLPTHFNRVPYCVASMARGQSVTPPDLARLSLQTCLDGSGLCSFCQALKSAFTSRYEHESWWQQEGSRLDFQVRYEWRCSRDSLRGVTVLVRHPGLSSEHLEYFAFAVGADPGK